MSEWPHNQIWHEKIGFPGHKNCLEINAESYNAWIREVCLVADPKDLSEDAFESGTQKEDVEIAEYNKNIIRQAKRESNIGFISKPVKIRGKKILGDNWIFGIKTFSYYVYGAIDWLQFGLKRRRLAVYDNEYDCFTKGAVMFTGPVHIPIVLYRGRPMMSLTPMEIYTLREALRYAKGHVVIGGLGLGWLARRVAEKPGVTKVTVVELAPEIIDFFGEPLKDMFTNKIDFVCGDIYEFISDHPPGTFNTHLIDIWQQFGEAEDDEQFQELKETYPNTWGWGDGEICDYDEPTYEDEPEDEFENDQACWGKDEPQEWWGID